MSGETKYHKFRADMARAVKWEVLLASLLNNIFNADTVRKATPEEQRRGIDFIYSWRDPSLSLTASNKLAVDVKIRDHKFYGKELLLETESARESNKWGWIFTSESDIIAFAWKDAEEKYFMPISYLLQPAYEGFRDWFEKNSSKFLELRARNEGYTTVFRIVEPEEIRPRSALIKANLFVGGGLQIG